MARVKIENLKKYFGNVKALNGIDIEIKDGKFVVLLGPSGCGKTTLLRCISGLEKVTDGKIFFDSVEVTNLSPRNRNVSMVFQSYAVWPHMKVYENIAYPMRIKGYDKDKIKEKVVWAADTLNISELLNRYPAQLSGGQRQRVAVARAIVLEPAVLLMDEPLSNLDALLRVSMRSELKKLQERIGTTTIYVTHDQVEAMTMGDEIAVMHNGVIQQFGTPEDIYHRPANIFVAGFIGSPQMNFLEVEVIRKDNVLFLRNEDLSIKLPKDLAEKIENDDNKKLILGIRPEDIHKEKDKESTEFEAIEGKVYFTERLGSDTIVHLDFKGIRIVSKLPGDVKIKEGENLKMYMDLGKVHLFSTVDGKALI
ncbi:MAG TPA: ABC transporter ATP-binding protein [Thermotogaceae bacterium]|nr:ABC transporter ATP-binding protein [Thermotogaceae bacterium]